MYYAAKEFQTSELDTVANVIGLTPSDPLNTFAGKEMWYQVFLWALFSSIFVHVIAAAIAFATLRKHRFGNNSMIVLVYVSLKDMKVMNMFFPIFILVMGVLAPLTSGVVSSAAVAFVYRASSFQMEPLYALIWGVGQTFLAACIGFTRILATL
ncbi:Transmembrane protein 170A [Cryptotermes secundus]|uniref:Transmembrane protein 170A n=1 Tax=Cryptotermes secundus TaxID=105785 RepID=A0A2J7PMH4_9NEOP|nr:Transmembrane protein 170A [Cryptotermes secundus]